MVHLYFLSIYLIIYTDFFLLFSMINRVLDIVMQSLEINSMKLAEIENKA